MAILRAILGVISGFLAMSVFVMAAFPVATLAIGAERLLRPGSYEASAAWTSVNVLLGLPAALLGGFVCACVTPSSGARYALVAIAVVFGVAYAAIFLVAGDPGPRTDPVGHLTVQFARPPAWLLVANPLIDALGIHVGSRLALRAQRLAMQRPSRPADPWSSMGG